MHPFKSALRFLFVGSLLALSSPPFSKAVEPQEFPPDYGFVTVADESGKPVVGAAVIVYNAGGEEIFYRITNMAGAVRLLDRERETIIREQRLGSGDHGNCIVRIVNTGYRTYEVALEGDLEEKIVLGKRGNPPAYLLQVTLIRRAKSKTGDARKSEE